MLAKKSKVSKRTIQRRLDKINVNKQEQKPADTVVMMDTSYFGSKFGVMVFRDNYQKKNIHWKFVKHEKLIDYITGIEYLKAKGWNIVGVVCDGKRGMFSAFGSIPVQMCQYHQVAIVTRYITKKPRLSAGKELRELTSLLTKTDKESFIGALNEWHSKWKHFLAEKTINPETRKWHYTHKRIRSAYRSLKNNLPYLFTWYDYPDFKIPNTNNSLEGIFSNLKTKLRVHSGLKEYRKKKVIDEILI